MKVQIIDNKPIYSVENIRELFRFYISAVLVREIKEGYQLPPFYLPVRRPIDRDAYELWILPLAPFVWLYYLATALLWKVWIDMQTLIDMIVVISRRDRKG
ncbi:MAG: hypothetical protein FMNOHCHN_03838 [Ignavibacteriaceae bacterium]|nr:hypothetical protein [Ignavibacteriaceae bacterium]